MRLTVVLAALLLGVLLVPGGALAATCADYANQAAAQRAADTRDGDGIDYESLPCPCLGAGSSSPPPPAAPPPVVGRHSR